MTTRSENDGCAGKIHPGDSTSNVSNDVHTNYQGDSASDVSTDLTVTVSDANTDDSPSEWFSQKVLCIAHLNVHYLYPKLDEIRQVFNNQPRLDIFCLCETFLNDHFSDCQIGMENYVVYRKDRLGIGGGLVIYVRDSIPCILRHDIALPNMESLFIEVRLDKTKSHY